MFEKLIIAPAINNQSLLRVFLYIQKGADIAEIKKSNLVKFFSVLDAWGSDGILSHDNSYITWEVPTELLSYFQTKFFKNGKHLKNIPNIEFLSL